MRAARSPNANLTGAAPRRAVGVRYAGDTGEVEETATRAAGAAGRTRRDPVEEMQDGR